MKYLGRFVIYLLITSLFLAVVIGAIWVIVSMCLWLAGPFVGPMLAIVVILSVSLAGMMTIESYIP